jgi:hypothetical protein
MKLDWILKSSLAVVVLFLGMIALRPLVQPAPVSAQTNESRHFYVEPGTTMLRKPDGTGQVYGKVFIDMSTGDVWDSRPIRPIPIHRILLVPRRLSRTLYTWADSC